MNDDAATGGVHRLLGLSNAVKRAERSRTACRDGSDGAG
jgi:hypothetical protein